MSKHTGRGQLDPRLPYLVIDSTHGVVVDYAATDVEASGLAHMRNDAAKVLGVKTRYIVAEQLTFHLE